MKRKLLVSILLTVLLFLPSFSAYAQYDSVKAEIAVEIIEGGTAAITPEVNSPIPDKSSIKLKNGEIGKFNIYFTDVGIYSYTVRVLPDSRDLIFDTKVYDVKVYVTDEDGKLATTVIAYTGENKYSSRSDIAARVNYGPERLVFSNSEQEVPPPPDPTKPTEPEKTTKPSDEGKDDDGGSSDKKRSKRSRNPKTGDDSEMERYFLVATIASAGLFTLSLVYLADTQKTVKRKRDENK